MNKTFLRYFIFLFIATCPVILFGQGSWRWDQKVLNDDRAILLKVDNPIPTTVSEQVSMIPYKHMANGGVGQGDHDTPRDVSEDTVYTLDAYIVGYKIEGNDQDYHIVLMDRNTQETLVSEIPDPTLPPASKTPYTQKWVDARKSFNQILRDNGLPAPTQTLNGDIKGSQFRVPVKIVGVGFWDIYGHQNSNTGEWVGHGTGSAISGREIHPILSMTVAGSSVIVANNVIPKANATSQSPDESITTASVSPSTNTEGNQMPTTSPEHALAFFLLAALLGMAGQVFHLIVGLKKASDANPDKKTSDIFSGSQFLISLGIAATVGSIAAILAAVVTKNFDVVSQTNFYAYIAVGYAGTDFIEGFVMKN